MKRPILFIVFMIVTFVAVVGFRLYNKPHAKAEDVKGLAISAEKLVESYQEDETKANEKFLNKVLVVQGKVATMETNQDGGNMIVLESGDEISAVQATMREGINGLAAGAIVTVKGFCSGNNLTGVSLTDCVLVL